jgi:hypothetical protein
VQEAVFFVAYVNKGRIETRHYPLDLTPIEVANLIGLRAVILMEFDELFIAHERNLNPRTLTGNYEIVIHLMVSLHRTTHRTTSMPLVGSSGYFHNRSL